MLDNWLPKAFREKMKNLLGQEYPAFEQSYSIPRSQGLRVNTQKISIPRFLELSPFSLRQVTWLPEGFYYPETARPGKHPFHAAGLYYIQEPSAMVVGAVLDPPTGRKGA